MLNLGINLIFYDNEVHELPVHATFCTCMLYNIIHKALLCFTKYTDMKCRSLCSEGKLKCTSCTCICGEQ